MYFFKRGIIYLIRNKGKSGLLFMVIFILGILISGGFSMRKALLVSQERVIMGIPAVSALWFDDSEARIERSLSWDAILRTEWPTLEQLLEIGSLPYVRTFDINLQTRLFGSNLEWVPIYIDGSRIPDRVRNSQGFTEDIQQIEGMDRHLSGKFPVRGVMNPSLLEIEGQAIYLIEGRSFTEEEVEGGAKVAIIPAVFAQRNSITLGDLLSLEAIVQDTAQMYREGIERNPIAFINELGNEQFYAYHQVIEFEVIGIFEFLKGFDYDVLESASIFEFSRQVQVWADMQNMIYAPFSTIQPIIEVTVEAGLQLEEVQDLRAGLIPQATFVLNHPRNLGTFSKTAEEILPDFWKMEDFSGNFRGILEAIAPMEELANFILWLAAGGSIVVLTLLMTLSVQDRKYEMGLYIAFGEKKVKILLQLLMEVTLIAALAIGSSVMVGNRLSESLSKEMFERAILERESRELVQVTSSDTVGGRVISLFLPAEISNEDLFAMYETRLDGETIFMITTTSFATIFVSISFPAIRIMTMKTKTILK